MAQFTKNAAADYDGRIVRLVPGYDLLHELSACMLSAHLPAAADVLIAGLGTGRELVDLAARRPHWRFTAVDPSPAMLDVARARAVAGGYADRVVLHAMAMQAYDGGGRHDGALALLVAHFVPDDGGRLAFLQGLARSLAAQAPLLLVDLVDDSFHTAYRAWALARGMDDAEATAMFTRMAANFHPIGEARLRTLLGEAGFGAPVPFFRALGYCGYLARRN